MKNVPDELLPALRNRPGDLPMPGNSRWGKVARLTSGTAGNRTSLTFVQTDIISPTPIPIAIKLRFSEDGITYTPEVPALFGGNMIIDLIETIDMKSGPFKESFTLAPGDPMPICATIACALTLSVKLDGEDTAIFVQAVAAPTTMIDCADVTPAGDSIPAGFNTVTSQFPAAVLDLPSLPANARRAYLLVVNESAVDFTLYLHGAAGPAIVLPGGIHAGYDVSNFRGALNGVFSGNDAGYVSITEGTYV